MIKTTPQLSSLGLVPSSLLRSSFDLVPFSLLRSSFDLVPSALFSFVPLRLLRVSPLPPSFPFCS